MRNKSMSSSRSIARFMILALCFVMMFAIVLSLTMQTSSVVANAEYTVVNQEKNDDATLGYAGAIYGDHGQLNGTHFGYPGTGSQASWTFTETYATVVPSTSNHQVFKVKGNTKMYTHAGEANHWQIGVSNAIASAEVHGVINFNLTGFMAQMVQNDNVSVTATIKATMSANSRVNNMFYAPIQVPAGKAMTGGLSYDLRNNATESKQDKTGFVVATSNNKYTTQSSDNAEQEYTIGTATLDKTTPNFALAFGCGWNQESLFSDYDRHIYMHDIKVTFTITFKDVTDSKTLAIGDNQAPVASSQYGIQNEYSQGVSGSGYFPNLTDAKDADVYYDSIKSRIKTDSVTNGAGKLQSYTNKPLNQELGNIDSTNATAYYKYAQTEFVDLYNYSGESSISNAIKKCGDNTPNVIGAGDRIFNSLSVDSKGKITIGSTPTTDATHLQYVSGIKKVTVNETEFDVYNSADYTLTKEITEKNESDKDDTIGYARVSVINRSRVVVMLYMIKNGTVQTSVEDYGGLSVKTKIDVSGIDTEGPNVETNVTSENYIGTNIDNIDWYRNETLSAECGIDSTEDSSDASFSPYIWFYNVERSDTGIFNSNITEYDYLDIKTLGILPIECGDSISSFNYDFKNGLAQTLGYTQGPISGEAKGAGFYRFTFYMFDLAGNKGGCSTYVMKVDYEDVEYSLNLSYGSGDSKVNIVPSNTKVEDLKANEVLNGAWATSDITLKIKINQYNTESADSFVGFSGYTLSFVIADEKYAFVVDGYGTHRNDIFGITKDEYETVFMQYLSPMSSSAIAVSNNKHTIDVQTVIGTLSIEVVYAPANREFTFTIKAEEGKNFAWTTTFDTNPGFYNAIGDIEDLNGYVNASWNKGVQMLLDCTSPETPVMMDDESAEQLYINSLGGYDSLPQGRVWFTESLKSYPAIIEFFDDIIDSDYAGGVNVYYGFKVVKTLDDLKALGEQKIEDLIASKSFDGMQSYFNKSDVKNGYNFDSKSTELEIDLIPGQDAGMRVFYVWAEDQAGNKSAVNTYYVLADVNQYTISATVKSNSAFAKGSANISFTGADGVATTTFKRGETVVLSLGLMDGYSPFYLSLNGTKLLENYMPNADDNTGAYAWSQIAGTTAYVSTVDYSTVNYTVDDSQMLGKLDSKQKFEFAPRKVVGYTITSNKVGYTAEPTNVKNQVVFDDIATKNVYEVKYLDGSGNVLYATKDGYTTDITKAEGYSADPEMSNPQLFVPTNVGNYKVALFIDKNNGTYVDGRFAMNDSGEQVLSGADFAIIKGTAVITATPSTSVYGEGYTFKYAVSGITESELIKDLKKAGILADDQSIIDKLALNVSDWNSSIVYNVGAYQIVCKIALNNVSDNYDVIYEDATYTITQREVYVYALGGEKQYKQVDPDLKFGVSKTAFSLDTLASIFAGYRQDTQATADSSEYVVYYADGRLARESGEVVGKYSYINTASRFDVNSNYRIVLQTTNTFEIKQRVVTLDVSGQSSVYPYGTTVSEKLAEINPIYRLSASDEAIADEIAELLKSLTLDSTAIPLDSIGYDSVTGYGFVLTADETANLKLVVDPTAQYVIYVTEENTIIIRAKAGVTFASVYGLVSSENFALPYSADKFEIVGTPSGEYTSVVWTANIGVASKLVGAGNYVVTFSDAKLMNGETALADSVVVEKVVYTVNPANVVIKPVVQNTAKTYGEDDSVYGIDFEIVSIEGITPEEFATAISMDVSELKNVIVGAYSRVIFDKNGNKLDYATRYDSATANDVIIGTDGRYYGIAVVNSFGSSNPNFSVEASLDDELKLAINAKEIAIHTKDLVGISKYYDGTTAVHYGTISMYNIASYLARTMDDVALSAEAVYGSQGSASTYTTTHIEMNGFKLVGDDAHNYVLANIVNDGVNSRVGSYSDGNFVTLEGSEIAVGESVVVRIFFIDNTSNAEQICINMGFIGIVKSDITITKQYDNTNKLDVSNIFFKNGAGTSLVANNKNMILVSELSGVFSGRDVGTNYLISKVTVFLPFNEDDLDGIDVKGVTSDDEYYDPQVQVTKTTYTDANGVEQHGVMITIYSVGATITKRVLNADSFISITAVDREYNGNETVGINYQLADGALGKGDEKSLELVLEGTIDSKNAGRHTVKSFAVKELSDKANYTVDLDSIVSRFSSVEAEISKATLVPIVTFEEKIYDATSAINVTSIARTTSGVKFYFTTAYADELQAELGCVSFDTSKVSFTLSLNGKANADVQANGKHNVLVSGMEIIFTGTSAQKADFMQNFKLAGSRYSSLDNKYVAITDVSEGAIADFELLDFVELKQKEIKLTSNDFKIADKIYDGSADAVITIDIKKDAEGNQRLALDEHEGLIEVVANGRFESRLARDNSKVIIDKDSIELRVKSGTDGASIIGNYKLILTYDPEVYGNIKPRPVGVSASFGTQEYNGQENVKNVSYILDGVLEADKRKLTVRTVGGAYFDDKNVALDVDGNIIAKNGTAYGVELSNDLANNYTATIKSATEIAGRKLVAYVKDNGDWVYKSAVANEDEGKVANYYYALETTQKYILASSTDKLATAIADNAIVGFNIIGGKDVYMLASDYTGDEYTGEGNYYDGELAEALAYVYGEGTVTKRVVRISSSGIQKAVDSSAFTKQYDGTAKFTGVNGIDYFVTSAAVSNVIEGDEVLIESVTAMYESVRVGSTNVVFTISGITGKDRSNYTEVGTASLSVRLSATITPMTIDAQLVDAQRVYGSNETPSNVVYSINGSELIKDSKLFYMNYKEWLVATGFIADVASSVDEADKVYVESESMLARRYNLVDGTFVADNAGEYIRIGGSNDTITELPKARAQFTSTKPNAGTTAESYTLTSGKATNYVFNPIYTHGDTSTLEVVKKDIYIVTETKDFTKTYGSANPEIKLSVLDASGANGFASNDQWNTIFKVGSVDYGPIAKVGIFNRTTGKIVKTDDMAKISADLGDDEVYVFYLEAPTGANYSSIANYTIHYQDIDGVSKDGNSNAVWKLASFTKEASTLTITLPEVTGVSVGSSEENVFTYSYGVNWINEVLRGELATDEVRFLINGVESEAINAGIYEGKIILKRYINANGDFVSQENKDSNGYFIEWTSGETNVKITINKQTINLTANGMSVYYDGSNQSYSTDKILSTEIKDETSFDKLENGTDYTISYELLDTKTNKYTSISASDVKNAGKYRVTVAFTDAFETRHPNLAKGASVKASMDIIKAIINVKISTDGFTGGSAMIDNVKVTSLSQMFDSNARYEIGYTVAMDEKSNADSIAVDKSQTKLVVSKNGTSMSLDQINEAGKYTFAIVLNDESLDANNYTINGGAGVLELKINKINDANGNAVDLGEGTITANRLVVKEIANGTTLATDSAYLETIKSHVSSLSKQAGYATDARVSAVYRVTLYCDDRIVAPDGDITVSIAMPDTIDGMDGIVLYTVTEDGGLQKLTDYKVENGKIVYTTDYVSGIVFVDTNPETLAPWIIYTIIAVVSFVVLVVVATVVAIVIRKARLKKLD